MDGQMVPFFKHDAIAGLCLLMALNVLLIAMLLAWLRHAQTGEKLIITSILLAVIVLAGSLLNFLNLLVPVAEFVLYWNQIALAEGLKFTFEYWVVFIPLTTLQLLCWIALAYRLNLHSFLLLNNYQSYSYWAQFNLVKNAISGTVFELHFILFLQLPFWLLCC
jgi:hypothetical protein